MFSILASVAGAVISRRGNRVSGNALSVVATVLLVACSPAAPSPTGTPAKAATGANPSPAAGSVPAASTVNGEVVSVEGRVVTVSTNLGVRQVRVPDATQVQQEGKAEPSDLEPGLLVGVTGRPDGTALVVRIFPQGIAPKPAQFPMAGPQAGNVMTNARIDSFDGRVLTLDLDGQKVPITVPPDAEIVKPAPARFEDIQAGARLVAAGDQEGDVLQAQTVTILNQPPVIRAQ